MPITSRLDQAPTVFTPEFFTARVKKLITDHVARSPDQPFFLCLACDTPHAETQAPSCPFPEGYGLNSGLQWLGTPGKMINTTACGYWR